MSNQIRRWLLLLSIFLLPMLLFSFAVFFLDYGHEETPGIKYLFHYMVWYLACVVALPTTAYNALRSQALALQLRQHEGAEAAQKFEYFIKQCLMWYGVLIIVPLFLLTQVGIVQASLFPLLGIALWIGERSSRGKNTGEFIREPAVERSGNSAFDFLRPTSPVVIFILIALFLVLQFMTALAVIPFIEYILKPITMVLLVLALVTTLGARKHRGPAASRQEVDQPHATKSEPADSADARFTRNATALSAIVTLAALVLIFYYPFAWAMAVAFLFSGGIAGLAAVKGTQSPAI